MLPLRPVPPLGAGPGWPAVPNIGWPGNLPPTWPPGIKPAVATPAEIRPGPPHPTTLKPTEQICSRDGRLSFTIVRHLQVALQGCVVRAVVNDRLADGSWVPHECAQPNRHWSGSPRVAIKRLNKAAIAARCTVGPKVRGISEDAPLEMAVLQFLATRPVPPPGVARLLALLENADEYFVVLEYFDGGELLTAAQRTSPYTGAHLRIPELEVRAAAWQVLQGLRGLHGVGLCHRDFSLENGLISSALAPPPLPPRTPTVKLIDLGACAVLPGPAGALLPAPPSKVGKPQYYAPEMYRLAAYDGRAVDAWTFGIGLFALLTGSYPYYSPVAEECALFAEIEAGGLIAILDRQWPHYAFSDDVKRLLRDLLRPRFEERMSLADAEAHPWFAPIREAAAAAAAAAAAVPAAGGSVEGGADAAAVAAAVAAAAADPAAGGGGGGGGAAGGGAAAAAAAPGCAVCGAVAAPHH